MWQAAPAWRVLHAATHGRAAAAPPSGCCLGRSVCVPVTSQLAAWLATTYGFWAPACEQLLCVQLRAAASGYCLSPLPKLANFLARERLRGVVLWGLEVEGQDDRSHQRVEGAWLQLLNLSGLQLLNSSGLGGCQQHYTRRGVGRAVRAPLCCRGLCTGVGGKPRGGSTVVATMKHVCQAKSGPLCIRFAREFKQRCAPVKAWPTDCLGKGRWGVLTLGHFAPKNGADVGVLVAGWIPHSVPALDVPLRCLP